MLWWPELLPKLSKLQDFMAQVQQSYRASLSSCDVLSRRLLCAAAGGTGGAGGPWGFRHWAQQLKPWSSTWQWDLDQRRVRATAEHFAFDVERCESLSDWGAGVQVLGLEHGTFSYIFTTLRYRRLNDFGVGMCRALIYSDISMPAFKATGSVSVSKGFLSNKAMSLECLGYPI